MINTIEMKHNMAIAAAKMLERNLSYERKELLKDVEINALTLQDAEVIDALMGSIIETCHQFMGYHEQVGIVAAAERALHANNKFEASTYFISENYNSNVIVRAATDVFVDLDYVKALATMVLAGKDIRPFCVDELYIENRIFVKDCLVLSL